MGGFQKKTTERAVACDEGCVLWHSHHGMAQASTKRLQKQRCQTWKVVPRWQPVCCSSVPACSNLSAILLPCCSPLGSCHEDQALPSHGLLSSWHMPCGWSHGSGTGTADCACEASPSTVTAVVVPSSRNSQRCLGNSFGVVLTTSRSQPGADGG